MAFLEIDGFLFALSLGPRWIGLIVSYLPEAIALAKSAWSSPGPGALPFPLPPLPSGPAPRREQVFSTRRGLFNNLSPPCSGAGAAPLSVPLRVSTGGRRPAPPRPATPAAQAHSDSSRPVVAGASVWCDAPGLGWASIRCHPHTREDNAQLTRHNPASTLDSTQRDATRRDADSFAEPGGKKTKLQSKFLGAF